MISYYLGCYRDNDTIRDLNATSFISSSMTVNLCVQYCTNLSNQYAGVQNGSECYCGNSFRKYGIRNDSSCDVNCSGDNSNQCGAKNFNSIYATSLGI